MKGKCIALSYILALNLIMLQGCKQEKQHETGVFNTPNSNVGFDLDGIQQGGELIALTLYGTQSYFEFYGEGFGTQYKLADEYAKSIGCTMRVDVLHNEDELKKKLLDGDGDIVAYGIPVSDSLKQKFILCGSRELTHFVDSLHPIAWLVRKDAPLLAESLNKWMAHNRNNFLAMTTIKVTDDHGRVYTPRRRTYSPVLNKVKGEISYYDHIFKKYACMCGWDWKLLAAQAYQESGFDSNAVSYMGALGLMQLMPRTAQSVGVSISGAFDPERNVSGAIKLIFRLNRHYSSVSDANERIKFILAAYNGGEGHIDDARRLADKLGHNQNVWSGNVDQCVLRLSQSKYFNDPVVKYGFMRGAETYNYVKFIFDRWNIYRSVGR